jgi:hypothetical protein
MLQSSSCIQNVRHSAQTRLQRWKTEMHCCDIILEYPESVTPRGTVFFLEANSCLATQEITHLVLEPERSFQFPQMSANEPYSDHSNLCESKRRNEQYFS